MQLLLNEVVVSFKVVKNRVVVAIVVFKEVAAGGVEVVK